MRRIRLQDSRNSRRRGIPMSKPSSALLMLLGFISSVPFIVDMFILGNSYHYITILPALEIMGFILGGPLLLLGLVNFGGRSGTVSSTNDMDVARIRYAAEVEMMRKK